MQSILIQSGRIWTFIPQTRQFCFRRSGHCVGRGEGASQQLVDLRIEKIDTIPDDCPFFNSAERG